MRHGRGGCAAVGEAHTNSTTSHDSCPRASVRVALAGQLSSELQLVALELVGCATRVCQGSGARHRTIRPVRRLGQPLVVRDGALAYCLIGLIQDEVALPVQDHQPRDAAHPKLLLERLDARLCARNVAGVARASTPAIGSAQAGRG